MWLIKVYSFVLFLTRMETWPGQKIGHFFIRVFFKGLECYSVHSEDILNTCCLRQQIKGLMWWLVVASDDTFLWLQVKLQRGNSAPPINRKLDEELLGPLIRARPGFPHIQSLPSGSLYKPLILIHQRKDRTETIWPASWETCMQVRKQQLELDMEQQTGSKQEEEYIKAVYCHPA